MTIKKKGGIDEKISEFDKYVGLAKEAAKSDHPRADISIDYFFNLAKSEGKREIDTKTEKAVWDLFQNKQAERIRRVEDAIERYKKQHNEGAGEQLAWYVKELERLKDFKTAKTK